MKFVSTETGQAIQLFMIDEVRPLKGGPFLPDVIANVARRYRFVSLPKEFGPGQALKFETGFAADAGGIPINALEIYNDGIIVNTTHTDDADIIMDEFLGWIKTELKFREPQTKIPRRYYSRIIVELDEGLDNFIANFETCGKIVTRALGISNSMHVARMVFAVDPSPQPLTSWQIEPRLGVPFEAKRYFSAAPLSTNAHVDMLAALERAAKPGNSGFGQPSTGSTEGPE
jgi:hypothetical protein